MFPIEDNIVNVSSNSRNEEEKTSNEKASGREEYVLANGVIAENEIAKKGKPGENGDTEIQEKGKIAGSNIREKEKIGANDIREKGKVVENEIREKGKIVEMDSTQNIPRTYAKKYRFPASEESEKPFVVNQKRTSNEKAGGGGESNRGNGEIVRRSESGIKENGGVANNAEIKIQENGEMTKNSEKKAQENGKISKSAENKIQEKAEITDLGNASKNHSENVLRKYAKKYRFPARDEKLDSFSNDQKETAEEISANARIGKNLGNPIRENCKIVENLENAVISDIKIRGSADSAKNLENEIRIGENGEISSNAKNSAAETISRLTKKYKFPNCNERSERDLGEVPPYKFKESGILNTEGGNSAINKRKNIKNDRNQFRADASYDVANKARMNSALFNAMKIPYNNAQYVKLSNKNLNVNISIPKSKIWTTDAAYRDWSDAGMPLVKLNVRNLIGDGKFISERARNDEVVGGEASVISQQLDRLKILRKSLGSSKDANISENDPSSVPENNCLAIESAEVKLKIHDFRFRHVEFPSTRDGKFESEELLLRLVESENDGLKQLLADGSGLIYACYICDQRFDSEKNLKQHLSRESALLNYLCDSCESVTTFTNRCLFTLHVNYHGKSHNAHYLGKTEVSAGNSLQTTKNGQSSATIGNGESCGTSKNEKSFVLIESGVSRAKCENGESRATNKNGDSCATSENGDSHSTIENGESSATSENGESCATSENIESCETSENGESRAASETGESRATSETGESRATSETGESRATSENDESHPTTEKRESPSNRDETGERKISQIVSTFTCHECKKSVADLANHFSDGNQPRVELKCQICELHNQSRCAYSAHARIHTKKAPFVCPECGTRFTNWDTLESHMKKVCHYAYKKIQFQCPHAECKVLKSHSGALLKHFKTSHLESIFGCSDCSFSNLDKNVVKEHMAKEHEDAELFAHSGVFVCPHCPENVIYGKSLSAHIDLHINDGKYVTYAYMCDSCTHVSIKRKVFAEHFESCSTKSEGKPAIKFVEKIEVRSEAEKKCESCDRVVDKNLIKCESCTKIDNVKVNAALKLELSNCDARVKNSDLDGTNDSEKPEQLNISNLKTLQEKILKIKSGLVTSDEFEIENAKKRIPNKYANKRAKKEEEIPANTERRSARNIKCKFCKVFINRGWQYMRAHLERYHDSEFLYEGMTNEFDPNSAKNIANSKNFEDFDLAETVHKYKPNLKPERAAKKRPHSEIFDNTPPKVPRKIGEAVPSNIHSRSSLPNLAINKEKPISTKVSPPANEKSNKNLVGTPEKQANHVHSDPITPPARVVIPKLTFSDSKKVSPNKTPKKSPAQTQKLSGKLASKLDSSAETPKNHTCVHCFVSFASLEEFRGHIFGHRDHKSNHQCLECGKIFKQFPSLEKHMLILHKVQRLNTYFEANRQKFWDDMHKQIVEKNEGGKSSKIVEAPRIENIQSLEENQCDICFLKCSSKELLQRHARSHGMAFVSKQSRQNKLAKNECC